MVILLDYAIYVSKCMFEGCFVGLEVYVCDILLRLNQTRPGLRSGGSDSARSSRDAMLD